MAVAICGNVNIDINAFLNTPEREEDNRIKKLSIGVGGTAANTAVHLARIREKVVLYCSFGRDVFAEFLKGKLAEEGVKVVYNSVTELSTGLCFSRVDKIGERKLFTYRGANELIDAQLVNDYADIVYFAGIEPEQLQRFFEGSSRRKVVAYSPGGIVSFERPESVIEVSKEIDHLIVNEKEYEFLSSRGNIRSATIVITLGDRGARIAGADVQERAYPANVVDTTGAGDCFSAGYLFGLARGFSAKCRLKLGNLLGALSVSVEGAQGVFTIEKLRNFARTQEPELFEMVDRTFYQ